MRSPSRALALWTVMLAFAAPPAAVPARGQDAPPTAPPAVTIVTDGLADPGSRANTVTRELAIGVDRSKLLRALAIMGYGGERNARDLLQGRADFAVLNSDILAHLSIINAHHHAPARLRLVTRLFPQRVFLFARAGIASFAGLAGRKVAMLGPEATTGVAAHTVFALARVPAAFVWGEETGPIEADGAVVLEGDAARWLPRLAASGGFRLIPLPAEGALARVYRADRLGAGDAPGFTDGDGVATLALDTILAAPDLAEGHPRRADTARFIEVFFGLLPRLHKRFPGSVWNRLDIRATVPGWRRLALAADIVPTAPPGQEAEPAPVLAAPSPNTVPPRLAMAPMSSLADETLPGGGLLAEMALAVLREAFPESGDPSAISWQPNGLAALGAVLEAGGPATATTVEAVACADIDRDGPDVSALCDGVALTDPIHETPMVLILREGGGFDLGARERAAGHVLCAPADRPLLALSQEQRRWIERREVGLARAPTLADCAMLLRRGAVDAVLAGEIEARAFMRLASMAPARDGFAPRLAATSLAPRAIHIALAKGTPGAETPLPRINAAIARLRGDGRLAAIIARHGREPAAAIAR